jgi:hypothetical protein
LHAENAKGLRETSGLSCFLDLLSLAWRCRQSRHSTPGAASTGWRSRQGVRATGMPVWRSIFQAA